MNTIDVNLDEEMEAPCPCQKCGEWFDLTDGTTSKKWFPNTVICESCGNEEEKGIEEDEEVAELKLMIADAEYTIKDCTKQLVKLGHTPSPQAKEGYSVEDMAGFLEWVTENKFHKYEGGFWSRDNEEGKFYPAQLVTEFINTLSGEKHL